MVRIFTPNPTGLLDPQNRKYLERVMRLRTGDQFHITDGFGREVLAKLSHDGKYLLDGDWYYPQRELKYKTTLFPGITKGERFEWLIEKAVELGVTRVMPLLSSRSVVRVLSGNRLARWKNIAISAMLQCGGCQAPVIEAPINFADLPSPHSGTIGVLLHPASQAFRNDIAPYLFSTGKLAGRKCLFSAIQEGVFSNIWIASGPEGGFDEHEVALLLERKWLLLTLGDRIFRAETSPIVALSKFFSTEVFAGPEIPS